MESVLKRRSDENVKQYQIRLCSNKELYGITWIEVTDLLNSELGQNYGESKYRKWWTAYQEGVDDTKKENITSEVALTEIDKKTIELQKERVKLQTTKLEYNKMIREQSRSELFEERLFKAIVQNRPIDVPKLIIPEHKSNKELILPIADIHYGKKVDIKGLMGETINLYNTEVFEKRMWQLLEKTLHIVQDSKVNLVHLMNLSDSIDGILRMSQLQVLELGIVEQIQGFADFMLVWINELSKHVKVEYGHVLGNHCELRPLSSKSGEFPHENTEKIVTWFLGMALRDNPNVKINVNNANLYYKQICGRHILATHGQAEKNLEQSIKDYMMIYQHPIDMLLSGHYHTKHEKTIGMTPRGDIKYSQVPSICGVDEYALTLKKTANAGASIMILEEGNSDTITYDVILK